MADEESVFVVEVIGGWLYEKMYGFEIVDSVKQATKFSYRRARRVCLDVEAHLHPTAVQLQENNQ